MLVVRISDRERLILACRDGRTDLTAELGVDTGTGLGVDGAVAGPVDDVTNRQVFVIAVEKNATNEVRA